MVEVWYKKTAPLVLLAGLVLLVFHNALFCFFTQDDFTWLRTATNFQGAKDILQCFIKYNGAANYRPLTQELFFFINYKLFGLNPVAFHAAALAIHILNSFLVYAIIREIGNNRLSSFAGAVFYGVNATLFISIYWVSAVSESGMATFYLASLLFFIRFLQERSVTDYAVSFLMFIAALMSKESAIAIPPIMLLTFLYLRPKLENKNIINAISMLLPFIVTVIIYLAIRMMTIGVPAEGPYKAGLNFLTLVNLYNYLVWSLNGFQVFEAIADLVGYGYIAPLKIVVGLMSVAGLVYLILKQKRAFIFSFSWFAVALLPVLPFIHHAQNYYVNISIVGISLLIGVAINSFGKQAQFPAIVFVVFCVLLSIMNVRYQEKHLWVTHRAALARTALQDIKLLHPNLPDNATLYFSGTGEEEYWAYNFGDLFKLYYGNNRLATLFADRDGLPSRSETTVSFYPMSLQQGHLHDTSNRQGDMKDAAMKDIPAAKLESGGLSRKIDFTKEVETSQLIKGWYLPEPGQRWMARSAEALLPNSRDNRQGKYHLVIKGSAVLDYFQRHEVEATLKINDHVIGKSTIQKNGEYSVEKDFEGRFLSPMKLTIELNQSFVPSKKSVSSDTRELGLAVSSIELFDR
jgi:hypothetical protein